MFRGTTLIILTVILGLMGVVALKQEEEDTKLPKAAMKRKYGKAPYLVDCSLSLLTMNPHILASSISPRVGADGFERLKITSSFSREPLPVYP